MNRTAMAVLAAVAMACGAAAADEKPEGKIYKLEKGKSITITEKDVVRFEFPSPGSTGYVTTVAVIEGEATVTESKKVPPKGIIGGDGLIFDVKAKPGKTGKVKVLVTQTPPGKGRQPTVTKYEFEVK